MLSVADRLTAGHYLWREQAWRSSLWCVVSGFLFLLSCQMSVFIVTIATLERCWTLSRARGNVKTKKVSVLLCLVSWVMGFVLACVPDARNTFRSSGVCIPTIVPLPDQQVHHYTFGVFVVLDGVLMLLTIVGQGYIYATVCRNEMDLILNREGSRDLMLALRMMNISVFEACAWMLLAMLMLLTSHGVLESLDVSFTGTVLAIVTKPAVHPFLYVHRMFLERRRHTLQQRLLQWLGKKDTMNKLPS